MDCLVCATLLLAFGIVSCLMLMRLLVFLRKRQQPSIGERTIGFFHPYCNAGGGGERVLWCTIRAIQEKHPRMACVVYSGDTDATDAEILRRAKDRFNVELPRPVSFVRLQSRFLVEAENYPRFTLLLQSFGGLLLGCEALMKFVPDVFVDSMGYAFTLPLFRFVGGCMTGCYVHYPTISTDMLAVVDERTEAFNNDSIVARNYALSRLKLTYYLLFAWLYGLVGHAAHIVIVNSTWTRNHIVALWNRPQRTSIVYPPCDVRSFAEIRSSSEELFQKDSTVRILSIGQFRPEKNHKLQLQFLRLAIDRLSHLKLEFRLVLIGSCRHEVDQRRVVDLQNEAKRLKVDENVEWKLNVPFDELKDELSKALVGIHSMWNEHFGIGVVEGMAAGNIMMAHNSGGPKADIVVPCAGDDRVGYLCATAGEYVDALEDIVTRTVEQRTLLRQRASAAVERYSDAEFARNILVPLQPTLL